MKFVCSKANLLAGVQTVSKAVPNKTTMSILECILVDTTKGNITLTANDMELGIETVIQGTSKGIGIGDTSEAFLSAYSDYVIETSIENGPYQALKTDEIPFTESIRTILPTFFIDENAVTIEQICEVKLTADFLIVQMI